jgi:hypothetical protein
MSRLGLMLAACLLSLSGSVYAQTAPPPESIPALPEAPLPEWKPPVTLSHSRMFGLAPQLRAAEKLRLSGVVVSGTGWISIFAGGLAYSGYKNQADSIDFQNPEYAGSVDTLRQTSLALFGVGAVLAAGGFVLFTVGQARIAIWHRRHPTDQLPAFSGY